MKIDDNGYLQLDQKLKVTDALAFILKAVDEAQCLYEPDSYVVKEFNDFEFDCLKCAEYLMRAYKKRRYSDGRIYSRIVGTTSEIGNSDRDNANAVSGYEEIIDHDVDPEVGQAYFICRTDPKSVPSAGAAFYHAAFVIAKSDDYNFTLEAFHHRGWEFCYYSHTGENSFHDCWAGDDCFEGANVKTVAIELIQ